MKKTIYVFLFSLFAFSCFAQKSSNIDSVTGSVTALSREVDELRRDNFDLRKDLARANDKLDDYNDMFKQQWSFFSVILTVIGLIFAIVVPLFAYVSFRRVSDTFNNRVITLENQNTLLMDEVRNISILNSRLSVELSEKIADTNYILSVARFDINSFINYRIQAEWVALKEYINCFRATNDPSYNPKIQNAAARLNQFRLNDSEDTSGYLHKISNIKYFVDFKFLRNTTDLEEVTQKVILDLYTNLLENVAEYERIKPVEKPEL